MSLGSGGRGVRRAGTSGDNVAAIDTAHETVRGACAPCIRARQNTALPDPLTHPAMRASGNRWTGASRVAHPPLYMHAVATTPAEPRGCSCRSLPLVAAAFSLSWRDRLPHSLFSGPARRSLRVTACMLAESLRTLFSECFSRFVASTTVPSATGWNDTCRAGITPAERVCLCTAHQDARAPRAYFHSKPPVHGHLAAHS